MENSNLKDLSNLEIMYNKSIENRPKSLKAGLTNKKNKRQAGIYRNSFTIKNFIEEKTFTNLTLPAVIDAIGNNFIKIGVGISAVISAIGYTIEKLKN